MFLSFFVCFFVCLAEAWRARLWGKGGKIRAVSYLLLCLVGEPAKREGFDGLFGVVWNGVVLGRIIFV